MAGGNTKQWEETVKSHWNHRAALTRLKAKINWDVKLKLNVKGHEKEQNWNRSLDKNNSDAKKPRKQNSNLKYQKYNIINIRRNVI